MCDQMWTDNALQGNLSLRNLTQPPNQEKAGLVQTAFSLFQQAAGGYVDLPRAVLFEKTAAARRKYTVLNISEGLGAVVRTPGANDCLRVWDRDAWIGDFSNRPLCMKIQTTSPKIPCGLS